MQRSSGGGWSVAGVRIALPVSLSRFAALFAVIAGGIAAAFTPQSAVAQFDNLPIPHAVPSGGGAPAGDGGGQFGFDGGHGGGSGIYGGGHFGGGGYGHGGYGHGGYGCGNGGYGGLGYGGYYGGFGGFRNPGFGFYPSGFASLNNPGWVGGGWIGPTFGWTGNVSGIGIGIGSGLGYGTGFGYGGLGYPVGYGYGGYGGYGYGGYGGFGFPAYRTFGITSGVASGFGISSGFSSSRYVGVPGFVGYSPLGLGGYYSTLSAHARLGGYYPSASGYIGPVYSGGGFLGNSLFGPAVYGAGVPYSGYGVSAIPGTLPYDPVYGNSSASPFANHYLLGDAPVMGGAALRTGVIPWSNLPLGANGYQFDRGGTRPLDFDPPIPLNDPRRAAAIARGEVVDIPIRPSNLEARRRSVRLQKLGDDAFAAGDYREAASQYRQASIAAGDLAEPRANLGIALAAAGHPQQSAIELKRAVSIDANWPQTARSLDELFTPDRQLAKESLLDQLRVWARQDTRDPDRLFVMGVAKWLNGDRDESETFFTAVDLLSGSPKHVRPFLQQEPAAGEVGSVVSSPQVSPYAPRRAKVIDFPRPATTGAQSTPPVDDADFGPVLPGPQLPGPQLPGPALQGPPVPGPQLLAPAAGATRSNPVNRRVSPGVVTPAGGQSSSTANSNRRSGPSASGPSASGPSASGPTLVAPVNAAPASTEPVNVTPGSIQPAQSSSR